ncbi:MAG: hypothetical protein AABY79_10025 [Nitrospirota bacterium]|jgi:hypothetical protein
MAAKILIILLSLFLSSHNLYASDVDFKKLVEKQTRGEKIYKNKFVTTLVVSVVYRDARFREGYVHEYAKAYQLTKAEEDAMLAKEKSQDEKEISFYLFAYTEEEKWNNFDKGNPAWKIYLKDDKANRLEPLSVKKFTLEPSMHFIYFPMASQWMKGYEVTFTKGADFASAKSLTIVLTGFLGNTELTWEINK